MSYSLSRQDLFVMHMMKGKAGNYLEIGASHPQNDNNTLLLEQNGWKGISIDIDPQNEAIWKSMRQNELMITDALKMNYIDTDRIDYLQLDIDPPEQTFQCLINLLSTGCRFSIITFEHDAYTGSPVRDLSRQVLKDQGYYLAVPDVMSPFGPYEDWWIDSNMSKKLAKAWS
jgi:hypothetical protein